MNYLYTSPFTARHDPLSVHYQFFHHIRVAIQTQPDSLLLLCPSAAIKAEWQRALQSEQDFPFLLTLDEWVHRASQSGLHTSDSAHSLESHPIKARPKMAPPGLLAVCMAHHLAAQPRGLTLFGKTYATPGFCEHVCQLYLDSRRYGFSSGVYTRYHDPKKATFIVDLLASFSRQYGHFIFDSADFYQTIQAAFYMPIADLVSGKTVFCYGFWDIPDYQRQLLQSVMQHAASCSIHVFYVADDPIYKAAEPLVNWLLTRTKSRHIGSDKRSSNKRGADKKSLAQKADNKSDEDQQDKAATTWHRLHDVEQECRWVLSRIRKAISMGTPPDDIAIIIPSQSVYGPPLSALSRQADLPISVPSGDVLASSAPIRVIRHVMTLNPGRGLKRHLITLFRDPFARNLWIDSERVEKERIEGTPGGTQTEGHVENAQIEKVQIENAQVEEGQAKGTLYAFDPGEVETWLTAIAHVETLEDLLAQLGKHDQHQADSPLIIGLTWLSRWVTRFRHAQTARDAADCLRELITAFQLDQQARQLAKTVAKTSPHDAAAAHRLIHSITQFNTLLYSLTASFKERSGFDIETYIDHLMRLTSCQPIRVEVGADTNGTNTNGANTDDTDMDNTDMDGADKRPSVLVMTKFDSVVVERPIMILMGAIEGCWPSSVPSSILASDAFKKKANWPANDTFYLWDRYLFFCAISKASQHTFITQPIHTTSQTALTSHFLMDLQRQTGLMPVDEDTSTLQLTHQDRQCHDAGTSLSDYPDWILERERSASDRTGHGILTRPDVVAGLSARLSQMSFSATQLEAYQQCPHYYFFRYGLRQPEPQPGDSDYDRLKWGTMIHEVFETFFKQLTHHRLRLHTPAHLPEIQQLLARIASDAFSRHSDGTLMWEMKRPSLMGHAHKPGLLEAFLDIEMHTDWPFYPVAFEYPIELTLHTDTTPIRIRGVVDQILKCDSPHATAVLDYKTGSLASMTDIKTFRRLQLPLYILGVAESPDYQHSDCVAGILFQVKSAHAIEKKLMMVTQNAKSLFLESSRKRPFVFDASFLSDVKAHIIQLRTLMMSGFFGTDPHPELPHISPTFRQGKCHGCGYKSVCRFGGRFGS